MNFVFFAIIPPLVFILVTTQSITTPTTSTTVDDPYIPPNKTSANHTALLQEFVKVFAGNDEEKKNILMNNNNSTIPAGTNDCYSKVFDAFKSECLYYYYQIKTVDAFKSFFHQLCETQWLQIDTIVKMITKTCAEKPYLKH